MILYNTLGNKKMEFVPHTEGKVAMYTCGPTVYHYAHIGNLRTYIMEDVLEKYGIENLDEFIKEYSSRNIKLANDNYALEQQLAELKGGKDD